MGKTENSHRIRKIFCAALQQIVQETQLTKLEPPVLGIVERMLDEVLSQKDASPLLQKKKAELLYADGNVARAVELFEAAQEGLPEDLDIITGLGAALYDLDRYQKALPYLEKSLVFYPDDEMIQFMTGFCLWQQGNREASCSLLISALDNAYDEIMLQYPDKVTQLLKSYLNNSNAEAPQPETP